MKRRAVIVAVAGLQLAGTHPLASESARTAAAAPGERDTVEATVLPEDPALLAAARDGRAIVRRVLEELEFPGLSAAVWAGGRVVWAEGFGHADLDREIPVTPVTVFPVYSISKALTGTALARLHQEGRIDMDAPVRRYLPEFPEKEAPITLRQLAGHLGGIRHYRPGAGEGTALRHCDTAAEAVAPFVDDPLVHAPGTDFHYTSFGFVLLSAALEAALGEPFGHVLEEWVFEPYGMSSTELSGRRAWVRRLASGYEFRDSLGVIPSRRMDISCKMGAGAVLSTAPDLARFAGLVIGSQGLSRATLESLRAPQRNAAGETIVKSIGWDVGADSTGRRWLRHVGGNVDGWTALMAYPDHDVAVVLLANMRGRDWIHDEAAEIADGFIEALAEARSARPLGAPPVSDMSGDPDGDPDARAAAPIAFVGVHVLPMDGDTVLDDRVVVVQGDRIVRIAAAAEASVPAGARRIDAAGAYLLPGLVDSHTHGGEEALPLYVAAGVTTARFMHGFPERLQRARRSRGSPRGPDAAVPEASAGPWWPTMHTAGPLIAGEEVPWPHALVTGPAEARREVAAQATAGYDFLKVYDGLSRASYDALVERATELGMPFAGHVPVEGGIERVLEAGQATIEHAEQLLYAAFGRSGVMTLPFERIEELVEIFRTVGDETCLTPTLRGMTLAMRRGTAFTDNLFERPEMELADPSLAEWWDTYRRPAPAEARERREHFLELQRRLTRTLHEAGVTLLAGTDAPYPLLVPGFSLLDEIDALALAGLSPFEALAAATANASACLDTGDRFGVVAEGARADLLLVEGNPLEDLGALRTPRGVMLRGRWLPADELGALVDGVRAAYGR